MLDLFKTQLNCLESVLQLFKTRLKLMLLLPFGLLLCDLVCKGYKCWDVLTIE